MHHAFLAITVGLALIGCRAYTESTPWRYLEGGPEAQYKRIFRKPLPSDVRIVRSVVVVYGWRPGVITTDDFEFEIVASDSWIQDQIRRFGLRQNDGSLFKRELEYRKKRAHPWYAPKPFDQYELYRDITERGFVHMLVQRRPEANGGRRIFLSKI